ncbi:MAG: PIN domain-containing protein [Desulfacinum sp.]|jgi:predicted nucleic acid-binding protein|nr:PIN domain-containing protein [Desulfacinum sp.]
MWPISAAMAEKAARYRAEHSLRTPDALQLAAAVVGGADCFLTNDRRLRKVDFIEVLVLDDYVTDPLP